MKILVFGDAHIPTRRDSIPKDFHKHISESRYDLALITGDLVREHEMRRALPPLPKAFIVHGNMDLSSSGHNHHEQVQLGAFNILLIHGTQLRPRGNIMQLWDIAMNTGANVAIHGHTHSAAINLYQDKLFLNPGTITGATGGWSGRQEASFIELDVDDDTLIVYLYTSNWKLMKVTALNFLKDGDAIQKK